VCTGLAGQMEHENGSSEYLKENSSLEGAGSAWEGSMIKEGSPWLRVLGVKGFVLDLCIKLLKGLQWTVSQDYCRLGTLLELLPEVILICTFSIPFCLVENIVFRSLRF